MMRNLTRLFKKWALSLGVVALLTISVDAQEKLSVLITGANRGLGLEYAKQYSEMGYQVYGTARKPAEAKELKETGAQIIKLDVTNDADIAAMAKNLEGKKIDILINNAGFMNRTEMTREAMNQSFSVNTLGPLYVAYALVPQLKLSAEAKIINVSSQLSRLTDGSGWPVAYAVSKTGLNMVTRHLHTELSKEGIIVISIDPGWNSTDMGGQNAPLKAEETIPKIIRVIASLKAKNSGGFYDYKGKEVPW